MSNDGIFIVFRRHPDGYIGTGKSSSTERFLARNKSIGIDMEVLLATTDYWGEARPRMLAEREKNNRPETDKN